MQKCTREFGGMMTFSIVHVVWALEGKETEWAEVIFEELMTEFSKTYEICQVTESEKFMNSKQDN